MTFAKCIALRKVKLPANLHVIAHGMFMGDVELSELKLPHCVTGIEDFAFYYVPFAGRIIFTGPDGRDRNAYAI